jgi:hypothetical protein
LTAEVAKLLADAGPWAVVLFLGGLALVSLWREHLKADKDDRDQRDLAQSLLQASIRNNAASIAAWNRRNEQDANRQRRDDKP